MTEFPRFPSRYAWIDEYMLAKPACVKECKVSWQAVLYRVHGKIFGLLVQDSRGRVMLNLKCDPYLSLWYRTEHAGIIPGWHMNKKYWNSLLLAEETPDLVAREMLDLSYSLVVAGLPRSLSSLLVPQKEQH